MFHCIGSLSVCHFASPASGYHSRFLPADIQHSGNSGHTEILQARTHAADLVTTAQ